LGVRRPLAAFLSFGLIAATGGDSVPIRDARWITPEARLEQLTTYVPPCSGRAKANPLYGAVAFHDPLLLGGQAARAGISCASCHRGGRGNTAFVFPGISGAPGTADVTSSIFSSHRGDFIVNPVAIPDLTFDQPKISRTEPGVLEAFIKGQIVEEFDGAEPPAELVASMAAFIRGLDPTKCEQVEQLRVEHDFGAYALAIGASRIAMAEGDRDTAIAMLRAARSRLGTIAERYPGDTAAQSFLNIASTKIATHQQQLRDGASLDTVSAELLKHWSVIGTWASPLLDTAQGSLYNRERLAAALSATRTP
jgi:hypothetical protein